MALVLLSTTTAHAAQLPEKPSGDAARPPRAAAAEGPSEIAARHRAAALQAVADNRLEDAAASFGKALDATPRDVTLLESLGNVYMSLGRFDEAAVVYERALPGVVGRGSGIPMQLALAYVELGDYQNAGRVLRSNGHNEMTIARHLIALRAVAQRRTSLRAKGSS